MKKLKQTFSFLTLNFSKTPNFQQLVKEPNLFGNEIFNKGLPTLKSKVNNSQLKNLTNGGFLGNLSSSHFISYTLGNIGV